MFSLDNRRDNCIFAGKISNMASPTLKEKTARGLLWGGLSNGVQQALNLLFGIFLARMLTPADYGMVGMLTIFSLIAAALQESGFTAALVNIRNIQHKDYNAVFWFSILMSVAIYVILFFCAPLIADFYETPELTALARYSFLGFVVSSFGTAQSGFILKNLMVKQRAISEFVGLVVSGCVGLLLAYNGFAYWGIATQSITYTLVVTLMLWHYSSWRPTWEIDFTPLKGMIGFSSKLLATKIFTQINYNIYSVLLGKFYNKELVGYYNQGYKWSSMGGQLILRMVASVAHPVLSSVSHDRERQLQVFQKMLAFTSFISFPVMLGLGFVAEELILVTIKEKWLPCVPIMQLLCISGAFVPINDLHKQLVISKGKSNIYLWNTVIMSMALIVGALGSYTYGIIPMVVVYVVLSICWLFVWYYFVSKEIDLTLTGLLMNILPYAFATIVTILLSWYITEGITNLYWLLVAKISTSVVIYVCILWICKASILKESIHFVLHKKC